jgi:hypothetical protein
MYVILNDLSKEDVTTWHILKHWTDEARRALTVQLIWMNIKILECDIL